MTEQPRSTDDRISETEATELMRSLLHKEGNWVNWGQKCQKLQKAGYDSQLIFEQTGFQNAQQNLIIVAAQVFESLIKAGCAIRITDSQPRTKIGGSEISGRKKD